MNVRDIETVASGLADARPGAYPNGGPDTDEGWKMWHACCYTIGKALAGTTRNWQSARFEALCNEDRK